MTFDQLFHQLDQHSDRLPLGWLTERLGKLEFDWAELEPYVKFSPDTYRRNLLRAGRAYHALILCWRNGQRSPIHDHFGSSCAVRVLRGTCTETIFQRTEAGHVYPTETHKLPEDYCCGSQDRDIHQISNIEPNGDLVTLHVYSPPLLVMGKYSLTGNERTEFVEQVHSFAEGAGI
jgi:cysteine dioxygenase